MRRLGNKPLILGRDLPETVMQGEWARSISLFWLHRKKLARASRFFQYGQNFLKRKFNKSTNFRSIYQIQYKFLIWWLCLVTLQQAIEVTFNSKLGEPKFHNDTHTLSFLCIYLEFHLYQYAYQVSEIRQTKTSFLSLTSTLHMEFSGKYHQFQIHETSSRNIRMPNI